MKKIRTLIVDDEPIAQQILETYLLKSPDFEMIAKCGNALEAFNMINKEPIDLMLLDINMPEISGMHFLKSLKNPPLVIFTTAYSEFAAESYDHNAIDYLLKPISFERFTKALDKVIKNLQVPVTDQKMDPNSDDTLFFKSEGKLVRIDLAQLWLAEGLKDYVVLRINDSKIIVHTTMKNLQDLLVNHSRFIRVHKSYIINIQYVSELDRNTIKIKNQEIPIGSTYREDVEKILRGLRVGN